MPKSFDNLKKITNNFNARKESRKEQSELI